MDISGNNILPACVEASDSNCARTSQIKGVMSIREDRNDHSDCEVSSLIREEEPVVEKG